MNEQLLLLNDVARLTETKPYRLVYLLQTNPCLKPKLRLGGRRMFTLDDVTRIKFILQLKKGQHDRIQNDEGNRRDITP